MKKYYESDHLAEEIEFVAKTEIKNLKEGYAKKELKLQMAYIRSKTPKGRKSEVNRILGLESLKVLDEINKGRIGSDAYVKHITRMCELTYPDYLSDPDFPHLEFDEKAFIKDMMSY